MFLCIQRLLSLIVSNFARKAGAPGFESWQGHLFVSSPLFVIELCFFSICVKLFFNVYVYSTSNRYIINVFTYRPSSN